MALVFGDEESGLSNADLLACDALSCIPAALDQPSFNLAQAVVLYAYELFQRSTRVEERAIPEAPPAVRQDYARLEESLRRLLEESRFSDVDRPRHGVKELVASLRRGELSAAEAKLWLAALQAALREVIAKRR